jgi:hypothetical protein
MKAFVLIWLGGLAVIGLVSVLYPPSDTIVNPTTYETVVQPLAVPSQPIDVSVVQRVTTQADALAVEVNRNEDAVAALSKRMDEITGKQAGISENAKALRVYVDERVDALSGEIAYESSSRHGVDILHGVLVALSSGLAIIVAIELYRHVRRTKGGRP